MFGGEIETEEVDLNAEASDVDSSSEEISDEEIDFSGVGEEGDTKVSEKE